MRVCTSRQAILATPRKHHRGLDSAFEASPARPPFSAPPTPLEDETLSAPKPDASIYRLPGVFRHVSKSRSSKCQKGALAPPRWWGVLGNKLSY
jgi:hypothetical protein